MPNFFAQFDNEASTKTTNFFAKFDNQQNGDLPLPPLPKGMFQMPDGSVMDLDNINAIDRKENPIMAGVTDVAGATVRGAPFVGSYLDEAAGALAGVTGGNSEYVQALAESKNRTFADENPKTSIALNVAGGIASTAPLAIAAVADKGSKAYKAIHGITQSIPKTMVASGAIGGVEGATYGYGEGTGGERVQNSKTGAKYGSTIGAFVPLVTKPLVALGNKALKGKTVRNTERMAKKAFKEAPDTEQLRSMKNAAYKQLDGMNAVYSEADYGKLANNIMDDALKGGISPTRHVAANSMAEEIVDSVGNSKSLTEIDQLRQVINRDLMSKNDVAEQHFGAKMLNLIDEFIENTTPSSSASGADNVNSAMKNARALNGRYKKSQAIDKMILDAKTHASGFNAGFVNEMKKIVRNEKRLKAFSKTEISAMRDIAEGKDVSRALTLLSKVSGDGNGLILAINAASAVSNPASLILPAIGKGIKTGQGKALTQRISSLDKLIKNGGDQQSLLAKKLLKQRNVQAVSGQRKMLIDALLASQSNHTYGHTKSPK